jgi:DNA-binding FrmR family transcriptional regulator
MTNKNKALRLSRQAQGMLAKVMAMIEQEEYGPAVIQQADSVYGFLHSVKQALLADHLVACTDNPDKQAVKRELLKLYGLAGHSMRLNALYL